MDIRYRLLNHLDKPVRFLYFTIDEAISLLGGFLLGGLAGKPLMGFISGLVISVFLSKIKKAHVDTSLTQMFYWYLPTHMHAYSFYLPSYIREFQG
jgi:conjugal transfer pilus assembly protein TraL